jgi:hypothetical protein
LATTLAAPHALAGNLAFLEASSELDDGRPRSYVYKLIDGKETTAWCSKPNAEGGETITLGFLKPDKVRELTVVVGAVRGGKLDKKRARAKLLSVSDGQMEQQFPLDDSAKPQKLKLNPPAKGRMIVVRIDEIYPGEPGSELCMGQMTIKGRAVYGGDNTGREVRSLPTPARRMLHQWVDEPSAPERTLILGLDGTFRYEFVPLMEGRPVKLVGKWRAGHRSLTLETRGKKYVLKKRLTEVENDYGKSQQMTLQGDAPHSSLNADFVIAPATLE